MDDTDPREMLQTLKEHGVLEGFRAMISPLEDYDREHKGDLMRTLTVFFEANANASEAAERLFLHRNSMAYRLDRIQQITGLDLKSPETRLALQLGLIARKERKQ